MKKTKTQKGITLVALIITIIVLLILAVVTISAVQDGGIIQYAQNARTEYTAKTDEENTILQGYIDKLKQNTPDTTKSVFESIKAANYGDPIEYSAGGVDDWKVFYKDDNYLYIITSDYLENRLIPNSETDTTLLNMNVDGTYCAYWGSNSNFRSAGASDISAEVANRFKLSWLSEATDVTGAFTSAKATGDLLNNVAWSKFAGGIKGATAIGTPTAEMWVASWNEKGELEGRDKYKWIEVDRIVEGYYINIADDDDDTSVANNDTLYFPYTTEIIDDAEGYWLASPYGDAHDQIWCVSYNGHVNTSNCEYYVYATRPVVCLPANVITINASGGLAVEQ